MRNKKQKVERLELDTRMHTYTQERERERELSSLREWKFRKGSHQPQVSVEPQQSMDLIVTCRPSSTGQFSGTANFGTNSGLPAFEAAASDATEKGEQFSMAMSCEGSQAPHLELDSFSSSDFLVYIYIYII